MKDEADFVHEEWEIEEKVRARFASFFMAAVAVASYLRSKCFIGKVCAYEK